MSKPLRLNANFHSEQSLFLQYYQKLNGLGVIADVRSPCAHKRALHVRRVSRRQAKPLCHALTLIVWSKAPTMAHAR